MAHALINFHLLIEPNTSKYDIFPAKIQSLRKLKNHQSRIKFHGSRPSTTLLTSTSCQSAVSAAEKVLSFVKSGSLESALQLFERMTEPNTYVWNVIIRGLVDSGMFQEAIELYIRMQFQGVKADNFTFPFIIKACAGIIRLKEGLKIHSTVIKLGLHVDIYICNALITMYAKAACIEGAEKIFGRMLVKDLVSWNSMISGYVSFGDGWSSLNYLRQIQNSGLEPDRFSFISGLIACALEQSSSSGKEIFCRVLKNGIELDSMIQSSLIDMFGKCGQVDYAERLFNIISQKKNIVVWNAMIGAYALSDNKSLDSFACLLKMKEEGDLSPDAITLINLLPSVSNLGALSQGKAIHGHALRKGYIRHLALETAFIDMYGKCGSINLAERAFSLVPMKSLVSWNAMIGAYVKNSENTKAVETFRMLLLNEPHHVPDETSFSSVLAAYAEIALPGEGKQIHSRVVKSGLYLDTFVSNALIHMYAKCGDLDSGRKVFDNNLTCKDIISWNTIIMGYAIHGLEKHCFGLFSEMIEMGFEQNKSTFVSILSACSITGNVDKGSDLEKRRSTTGYVFTYGGTAVSWISKLQKIVTLSTTEAEYVAVTEAAKELVWLQNFLNELGRPQEDVALYSDSQSAIHLAKNPAFHSRTKHIEVKYHFIRQLLEKKVLQLKKVPGERNPADMLIKAAKRDEMHAYHKQLAYCVSQFVEKEPALGVRAARGILRYWPMTNCRKEVLLIGELEELVESMGAEEHLILALPLCWQITKCSNSWNSQVAERALYVWNNERFVKMVSEAIDDVFPLIVEGIERNLKGHWSRSVRQLTESVKEMLEELEPILYSQCLSQIDYHHRHSFASHEEETRRKERWLRLEMAAQI
ncbi:Pentatricopeptide repeat-containing protein -chloroplastic [Striga hermonthica]|uniref:Pentatricopeptide repeat-containing protein -chloroplastic n=1 Tax=Striga hermonthica TaxID=68872 RepID=A0A9N7MLC9_STRHE|nr:Pentatricopeptide repeat-containing protein -chloroplastic [Striga hermonthica]